MLGKFSGVDKMAFREFIGSLIESSRYYQEKYDSDFINLVWSAQCAVYLGEKHPQYRLLRYNSVSDWIDELSEMTQNDFLSLDEHPEPVKLIDLSAALTYLSCYLGSIERDGNNPTELPFNPVTPEVYHEPKIFASIKCTSCETNYSSQSNVCPKCSEENDPSSAEIMSETPLSILNPELNEPSTWNSYDLKGDCIGPWLDYAGRRFQTYERFEGVDDLVTATLMQFSEAEADISFLLELVESYMYIAPLEELRIQEEVFRLFSNEKIGHFRMIEVLKNKLPRENFTKYWPLFFALVGLDGAIAARFYSRNMSNQCENCDGAFVMYAERLPDSEHRDEDGNPVGGTVKCSNPDCLHDRKVDWSKEVLAQGRYDTLFGSLEEFLEWPAWERTR